MAKVIHIKYVEQFQGYMDLEAGYILITDTDRTNEPNKIHLVECPCDKLAPKYFEEKVVDNNEAKGKYFYRSSIISLLDCAKKEMPTRPVRICKLCFNKASAK